MLSCDINVMLNYEYWHIHVLHLHTAAHITLFSLIFDHQTEAHFFQWSFFDFLTKNKIAFGNYFISIAPENWNHRIKACFCWSNTTSKPRGIHTSNTSTINFMNLSQIFRKISIKLILFHLPLEMQTLYNIFIKYSLVFL